MTGVYLARCRAALLTIGIFTLATVGACNKDTLGPSGSSDTTTFAPPAALEAIDYTVMGAGKVLFARFDSSNLTGPPYTADAMYMIDADAKTSTLVADLSKDLLLYPALSPRGDAILGHRWTDNTSCYDVYSRPLSGTTWTRLTSEACNYESAASWTPDGSGIVYLSGVYNVARWGLFEQSVTTATNTAVRTFALATNAFECPNSPDVTSSHAYGAPSKSSTGAYAYWCVPSYTPMAIVTVGPPPASTVATFLATNLYNSLYSPTWSPDGAQLAYLEVTVFSASTSSPTQSVQVDVVVVDYPAGTRRVVASHAGIIVNYGLSINYSACWLSGGKALVFTAPDSGTAGSVRASSSLFVTRADGSGVRRLTAGKDAHDNSVTCSR